MSEEIYVPPGLLSLDKIPADPQLRVGLQGPPGVGKTWEALTFPNPIVLNIDRGLGAHVGRSDVIEVPFYDPKFVDSIVKRSGTQAPPNRKDALLVWLNNVGMKLRPHQTLVIDSNTQIEVSFHSEYKLAPVITKSGKVDDFAEWNLKKEYFGELMAMLKSLPCHVVYIAHETADRSKDGELNGMVRPLLTGQFGDQLASHFTDYFRCHAYAKPTPDRMTKFQEVFKLDAAAVKEWLASTPNETIYLWQTQADEKAASVKTSTLVGAPKFVLADYKTFGKYKRQIKV